MLQGGKNCKTGTKFIIRDTAHRETVYLSQKQDRNTHLERSAGVLNEEGSKEVI